MKLNSSSEPKDFDFKWWPELVGLVMVIAMCSFLFGYAQGML